MHYLAKTRERNNRRIMVSTRGFNKKNNSTILKRRLETYSKLYFYPMEGLDDTFFMKKALEEAEEAYDRGEVPVGAIIVVQDRIIARSHNLTELLNDVTAHAEMQSITAAANFLGGKYLQGCTMYVTLEPCQMCAGALYWSQISKIVYGARDLERGYIEMGTKLHPKTTVVGGVMEAESSRILKKFFIEKRNLN